MTLDREQREQIRAQAFRLRAEGHSWRAVGRELGVHYAAIRRLVDDNYRQRENRLCNQRRQQRGVHHSGQMSPERKAWHAIIRRCTDPTFKDYRDYGGRGIQIADRWLDFDTFLADVGPRPSPELSIDRINNDGHYEPGNIRWATRSEQQANKRHPKQIAADRAAYEASLA